MYAEGDPATVLAKNTGFSENAYHLEPTLMHVYAYGECIF